MKHVPIVIIKIQSYVLIVVMTFGHFVITDPGTKEMSMRGSKAKKIRNKVYGDRSQRTKREYLKDKNGMVRNAIGTLRNLYKKAKKQ
jgi:hypothetical protein